MFSHGRDCQTLEYWREPHQPLLRLLQARLWIFTFDGEYRHRICLQTLSRSDSTVQQGGSSLVCLVGLSHQLGSWLEVSWPRSDLQVYKIAQQLLLFPIRLTSNQNDEKSKHHKATV